jgi:hypothetical protein
LVVSPAHLTITATDVTANSGDDPVLDQVGGFAATGLVNGETIGSVSLDTDATTTGGNWDVGTWTITPSAATDGTFDPSNYSITYNTGTLNVVGSPEVASIVVNGGDPQYIDSNGESWSLAGQNSVVEQLLVTFDEPVTLDDGAISIQNLAPYITVNSGISPNAGAVTANAPIPVGDGTAATQWIVTFSGPGTFALAYGGTGNVLDNGFYQVSIDASKVHANGTSMTSATHAPFWALYGAVNDNVLSSTLGDGNSEVFLDANDFNEFRYWLNNPGIDSTDPAYVDFVAYDYDLDGFVDADTFNAFRNNLTTDWTF